MKHFDRLPTSQEINESARSTMVGGGRVQPFHQANSVERLKGLYSSAPGYRHNFSAIKKGPEGPKKTHRKMRPQIYFAVMNSG